jgi:hypothetical protein
MQVRIMLQIVGDDGAVGDLEDVASLTKITEGAEDLGLSLAESKTLLAAAQQRIVKAQVDCWLERHRHCPISGRKLRCKGSYPVTFRIRDWRDRKRNFELIVGRSMPEEGEARYIGFVHGYDRKPQRRIIDHLRRQGFQADQDLTFITDGGDEVRALAERISPCSEHVLDWFHITMRITVLRQFAQGLVHHDKDAGMAALDELRRIKWFLWHGNSYRARETIDGLLLDLEALDSRYPNLRKFRTAMREFQAYIASNGASLINYGERYRSGERISSAFVEATVNAVISKRFAKKQQMQWTRRGAHLLLQTRTRTLDGSLRAAFEHWYPGMMNDNDRSHRRVAA